MLGIIQLRSKPWLLSGNELFASPAYMVRASPHCLQLLAQSTLSALALAFASAGNNKAARMAMMAITTSSSMSVNAGQPSHPREIDERVSRIAVPFAETGRNTPHFYASSRKKQVCVCQHTRSKARRGAVSARQIGRASCRERV